MRAVSAADRLRAQQVNGSGAGNAGTGSPRQQEEPGLPTAGLGFDRFCLYTTQKHEH